jgi:CubicO group peptidase (beta-lactamase class C family)
MPEIEDQARRNAEAEGATFEISHEFEAAFNEADVVSAAGRWQAPRRRPLAGTAPEVGMLKRAPVGRVGPLLSLLALLAVLLSGCERDPTAPIQPPQPQPDFGRDLAVRVEQAWTGITPGLRGVSVAVLTREDSLYTVAMGLSTPWPGSPSLAPAHRFRVASVSKSFAAALILKLAEEGLLGLDDKLTRHWPDCPVPNADQMTVRQLLSHTTGVFDHLNATVFWSHPSNTASKVWTVEELIEFAVANGPLFSPGYGYAYSNTGFSILEGVVERVLGASFREAIAHYLTGPMGLLDTFHDDASTEIERITGLAENTSSYRYHLSAVGAAGSIVSTPAEIARFGRLVYGGRFLTPASLSNMTQDLGGAAGGQAYGLGTRLWIRSGIPYHGHTGSLMNYRSILMYIPSRDVTVAICTHDVHSNWYSLVYDIFDFVVARL